MTLKTWLSSGHNDALKSKMAAAVDILPLHNASSPNRSIHSNISSGLTVLPNGDVTLRRSRGNSSLTVRENKFRSVEDGLESSGEQGDYGFLEYYSLRKVPPRENSMKISKPSVVYGTWDRMNGSCANPNGWPNGDSSEFYATHTLGDKLSRKRSRADRPKSYHHPQHQEERPIWQPDDMRTSTPLSPTNVVVEPPVENNVTHRIETPDEPSSPHRGCGLVKRNSVLWKLRPDRWRNFDGSLRRSRSKDDVLSSCKGSKKSDLGASQPDLLTSHGAGTDDESNNTIPPAFSILPPTCKSAVVNHSQTLPRGRRASDANKENTLLARGRRWLTGATFRGERTSERGESEIMVKVETVAPEWPLSTNIPVAVSSENKYNASPAQKTVPTSGEVLADLQQRSRARNRRPRTFYLLEDYLSPVRNPSVNRTLNMGVELDEYITRAPRLLFREAPKRPIPPTPEWDTPSLSPPPSLLSSQSGQSHQLNGNQSNIQRDRSVFVDTLIPSPEKSTHSIYSPVFSPRDSGYPRFVTPEVALPEHSYGMRHPISNNGLPATSTNAFNHMHTHNHNNHSNYAQINGLTRRPTEREDKRWSKSTADEQIQKSPGQQKDALQRIGRSGTQVRPPISGKLRQNGLVSGQKLPVLTNTAKSTSTSRVNIPTDSRDGDVAGSGGGLPVLNNNRGELNNESPTNRTNRAPAETNGIAEKITPQEALKQYGSRITEYERREIEAYPEIYYLGLDARKIHGEEGAQLNGGFDDENGSYNKVMHDHISYRYEILEVIGKGSFGQVIRALDYKTGEHVAIKIIRNKKRFHHQALVEVKILDHLRRKDKDHQHNIIHMLDYFYFRNHLCISFELMGLNLYELVKKNNYQGFSLSLIKRFAHSLVQCLKLLYKENIIHCDLKPENVLLKQRGSSSIRIIDFGSSCYVHQRVYTYIQSRFYRSPEVILGVPYGLPIDMWSLGCILAELYTGYPLFPGENEVEQLACIMEILSLPPQHLLMSASRRRLFFDSKGNPRCVTNSKGKKRKPGSKDLASVLKCSDTSFVAFIAGCLEWDPSSRMTPEEALHHEWLQPSSSSSTNSTETKMSPSASSSQEPIQTTSDRRTVGSVGGSSRRTGPINQNSIEDENISIYKVYKGKRAQSRDASLTRVSGAAHLPSQRSIDDHTIQASISASSTNTTTSTVTNSSSNTTKDQLTISDRNPSTENSLDDSGTFLPPIL